MFSKSKLEFVLAIFSNTLLAPFLAFETIPSMALLSRFNELNCFTAPPVDFSIKLPNWLSVTFIFFEFFSSPIPSVAPVVIFSTKVLISLTSNSFSPLVAPAVTFSTKATISLGYFSIALTAPIVAFWIMDWMSAWFIPPVFNLPRPLTAPSVTFSIIDDRSLFWFLMFPNPVTAPLVIFSTTPERLDEGRPMFFRDSEALLVIPTIDSCNWELSIPSISPRVPIEPLEIDSTAVLISSALKPASSRFCIIVDTSVDEAFVIFSALIPAERRFLIVILLIRLIRVCSGVCWESVVEESKWVLRLSMDFISEPTISELTRIDGSSPLNPIWDIFFMVPSIITGMAMVISLEFKRLLSCTVFAPASIKSRTWPAVSVLDLADAPDSTDRMLMRWLSPVREDWTLEELLPPKLVSSSNKIWPVCEFGSVTTNSSISRVFWTPSESVTVKTHDSYCPLERGM